MKKEFVLITCAAEFIFILITSSAFAKPFAGITEATNQIKIACPDIESTREDLDSFQTCFVFADFVALQLDSGQKGADSIEVRPLKKSNDPKTVCSSKDWPSEVKIPDNEQYVLGARAGLLFTQSADLFGDLGTVWVYDAQTGKQLFEANYDSSQDFKVTTKNRAIAVEFYTQLKVKCAGPDTKECWANIIKDNNLTQKVGRPDCSGAYKALDFKANPSLKKIPGAVQVFSKVKVNDLKNPVVEFLAARSTCNNTP